MTEGEVDEHSQSFIRFDLSALPDSVTGGEIEFAVVKLWVSDLRYAVGYSLR